jgi:hypothetical protein
MGNPEGKTAREKIQMLNKSEPDHIVKWQKVGVDTFRYRIPDCGWLVKVVSSKIKLDESKINVVDNSSSVCFVPDPEAKWLLNR